MKNNITKCKIAVIIPVYNTEKYIKKCIQSFQRQTFKDFKLILVDDGSKDKSGTICDVMAQKDDRIHVIHQENIGSVEARKTGVLCEQAQQTEYIFLSDADDVVEPDALEKLYKTAIKYDADCVCANMRSYWKGIKLKTKYQRSCFNIEGPKVYDQKEIIDNIYIGCFGITDYPVSLFAKLYKTSLITKAIDFPPIVKFM